MARAKSTDLSAYYIGKETTYGVGVVPTRHIKETGAVATLEQETVESKSRLGSRWASGPIRVGEIGKLSIPVELDPDNAQILFAMLAGQETVTGSSDPYTHTFTPVTGSTLPSASVTYFLAGWRKHRAVGAILNTLNLEITPQQIVTSSTEWIYKTESEQKLVLTAADFDTANDEIDKNAHGLTNGTKVKLFCKTGDSPAGGLSVDTLYYIVGSTTDSFQLSLTSGGSPIELSPGAVGTTTLVVQEVLSPTNELPFTYNDANVEFNGVAFGELRSANLSFTNNLDTSDFRFNLNGQLYAIRGGKFGLTGSLTVVFNEDAEAEYAKIKNQTATAIKIVLAQSVNRQLEIELPAVRYQSYSWGEGDLTLDLSIVGINQPPIVTLKNGSANAF